VPRTKLVEKDAPVPFVKLNRSDWIGSLVPHWDGEKPARWLDACSKQVNPVYAPIAKQKGYKYVQCDIRPEGEGVRALDLRVFDETLGKFEIVTCSDTLEHVDDYRAALANLRRYCVGRCYLHVPLQAMTPDEFLVRWENPHQKIDPTQNQHFHEWNFGAHALMLDAVAAGFGVRGCYVGMGDNIQCAGFLLVLGDSESYE